MVLATSLADCTKCLLATGLAVLDDARRQALQRAEVCLATIVAADSTYAQKYRQEKKYKRLICIVIVWLTELFSYGT